MRSLRRALGRPARLVGLPPAWLRAAAAMAGKRHLADRLCGSLALSDAKLRGRLGWRPPVDVQDGLAAMARAFRKP